MKPLRYLLPLLLVTVLSGCGLIYGQIMRSAEGAGEIRVISGDIGSLRPGSRVLVVGPFAKTRDAFYICRGEEAAYFAQQFKEKGLFHSDLHVRPGFDDPQLAVKEIKGMAQEQLAERLSLDRNPDLILFGTILSREMSVAPGRGVVMTVSYRLEFYDPKTRQSTTLEVSSRDIFADCIPDIVAALMEKIVRR
ncbi:MAG: hypothetical protein RBT64_13600 [Trichloromonas sp.]|jgi:hypothetical protein|nr:hypothetical protein [Trichloromonas sp.]